ncbi:MAG: TOBE domain-containing protein [Magnetococcales bacterium]|nr:TOBE domain-containing protein [Magnetococcales bacterium]
MTVTNLLWSFFFRTGGRKIDRLQLLEQIDRLGSINAAAKALGISYKAAWETVADLNNLSEQPLVTRNSGGVGGGGTSLTEPGRRVLTFFRDLEGELHTFLNDVNSGSDPFNRFYRGHQLMRRWMMKTSARNQFMGIVQKVTKGAVNAEVTLDIGENNTLVAIITNTSIDHLGLTPGVEAYALVKAPWIIVTTDEALKSSARNRLCGVVTYCVAGAVNGEVVIELPGGKSVTAIITNESIQSLGLKAGVRACALIKASHIILAVNS